MPAWMDPSGVWQGPKVPTSVAVKSGGVILSPGSMVTWPDRPQRIPAAARATGAASTWWPGRRRRLRDAGSCSTTSPWPSPMSWARLPSP